MFTPITSHQGASSSPLDEDTPQATIFANQGALQVFKPEPKYPDTSSFRMLTKRVSSFHRNASAQHNGSYLLSDYPAHRHRSGKSAFTPTRDLSKAEMKIRIKPDLETKGLSYLLTLLRKQPHHVEAVKQATHLICATSTKITTQHLCEAIETGKS